MKLRYNFFYEEIMHAKDQYAHSTDGTSRWSFQWHHNGCYGISNHWRLDCLLDRLFRRRSMKTSNLRVTGLCEGNSLVTGEFPSLRASNAEGKCFYLMVSSWYNMMSYIFSIIIWAGKCYKYICKLLNSKAFIKSYPLKFHTKYLAPTFERCIFTQR